MTALVTDNGKPAVLRDAIVETPVGAMVAYGGPDDWQGAAVDGVWFAASDEHVIQPGDVLPVVEKSHIGNRIPDIGKWVYRQVGTVRVVEVLPVLGDDFCNEPYAHLHTYGGEVSYMSGNTGRFIDLPNAVPGGVVLVVEVVD